MARRTKLRRLEFVSFPTWFLFRVVPNEIIVQLLFCVAPNEIKTVELDEEESFAESRSQEHKVDDCQNVMDYFCRFDV